MKTVDIKDLLAGAVLLCLGLFLAFNISQTLSMGTFRQLGPGTFPFAMAIGLAVVGVITMLVALRRNTVFAEGVDWAAAATITASILVFAGLLLTFGLLAAFAAQLLVASVLDRRFSWTRRLFYIAGLTAFGYLVFVVGLRIQVPVLEWPW